ncbi:hypothetical protein SDC9_146984 [bioreactor metagenome]|uniref:Uncharacterized protein n=1 Tax=bioreactor metagenome TaxID=1076179 RepID=A0A645ED70_9ZZZZ
MGKNYSVTELGEESKPKGVIFIHVEHSGDANRTFRSFSGGQRFVIKDAIQFVGIEVRYRILWQRFAKAALTAITSLIFSPVRKF